MISGPRWLKDPRIAQVVVDALRYGESVRQAYELIAWVMMPNHVHLVIRPRTHLAEIMRWLKASTGNRANRIVGRSDAPFWMREYYDHWVRSENELWSIIDYVERNPVTAGLALEPEAWLWSSAGDRRRQRPPAPHIL